MVDSDDDGTIVAPPVDVLPEPDDGTIVAPPPAVDVPPEPAPEEPAAAALDITPLPGMTHHYSFLPPTSYDEFAAYIMARIGWRRALACRALCHFFSLVGVACLRAASTPACTVRAFGRPS